MRDVIVFVVSAAALGVAGVQLAREGDVVADRTGLGRVWVGAILVAAATSLPEMVTDVSAVWQGAPDLALGDLFGSSMANMLVLAVADLLTRHTRMLASVAIGQLAVGALAVCLTAVAALGFVVWPDRGLWGIGWSAIAVGAGYIAGMRYLHRNRPPVPAESPPGDRRRAHRGVRGPLGRMALAAAVIVVAAPFLAASTASLADRMGVSQGFAGMLLLAITTSTPEAVVTLASLRQRSYDLAVGNLLGSNGFNMMLLGVLDVADGRGLLQEGADPALLVPALGAVLLTGLAMLGVLDRAERARRGVDLGPLLMIGTYVAVVVASSTR